MNGTAIPREEVATRTGIQPGAPQRDLIQITAVVGLKPKRVHSHNPQ